MIHAIILAGGRGKRLDKLSQHRPKATMYVDGLPLVCQVARALIATEGIDTIFIATGYLGDCVRQALTAYLPTYVFGGKVVLVDSPHIEGSLGRLAYTIRKANIRDGCLSCGIDVLPPLSVFSGILKKVEMLTEPELVLPVSPRLDIAPTHPRMQLNDDDQIVQYVPNPGPATNGLGWYSSIGMRYLARGALKELREYQGNPMSFYDFAKQVWLRNKPISAVVFHDWWRHFATPEDFATERVA